MSELKRRRGERRNAGGVIAKAVGMRSAWMEVEEFDRLHIDRSHRQLGTIILGATGNITCLLQFVAQLPALWKIYQSKSGHSYSAVPHVVVLFTYCLWAVYASPPINTEAKRVLPLLTASCVGIVFQTFFIFIYWKSEPSSYDKITIKKCVITGLIACVTLLISSILRGEVEQLVVGYICMIWTSSVFFAPVISMVVRVFLLDLSQFQKYSIRIRGLSCGVPCVVLTTIHRSVWTCYGIFVIDHFIVASYALGVVCGVLELCTLLFSKRAVPLQEETGDFHKLSKLSKSMSFSKSDSEIVQVKSFGEWLQGSPLSSPKPTETTENLTILESEEARKEQL